MKKKLMLAGAATLICFVAAAQIEQGRFLASGSLGFSFSKYREVNDGITDFGSTSTSLWILPRVGYFITNSVAVGTAIAISTGSTKYDDDDRYSYSSLSLTPFVRYYLPEGFFGQLELGPGIDIDKWKYANGGGNDKDQYRIFLWSLGAGFAHFLNENVAIEPIISYTSTIYTNKDNTNLKDKYGTLLIQAGFSIYLDRQP